MFGASLSSLLFLGGVLHLHEHAVDQYVFWGCVGGWAALLPLYGVEAVQAFAARSPVRWHALWCCLFPPLRLGRRDAASGECFWLPRLGWRKVDDDYREEVERLLQTPMLIVSLLVLPLILAEYIWPEQLAAHPLAAQSTRVATALVWWAFAGEFILMVSLTERKLQYCKQHWLDLAIILLPIVAFLRALRLGRLLRLQTLTKTTRLYRLRGVAMKLYRALLLIDAVQRLIQGSPERRLQTLRRQVAEQEERLAELRAEIQRLEERLAPAPVPQSDAA